MNIEDLKIYKTFYEYRNLTEVASRCNVSQPTVSYRLKKIEEELAGKLYTFDGRYHFNENGIRFYEFCKKSLTEFDSFKDHLILRDELHISLSSVATIYYMDTIYELLNERDKYPVISTTNSTEAIRDVADGDSVFAVVGGLKNSKLPSQLEKQRIVNETIVLAFNESLPDDIGYIPIVLDDRQSGLNPLAQEYLSTHNTYKVVGEIGKSFEKINLVEQHPIGIFLPSEYKRFIHQNHSNAIRISSSYFFQRDMYIVYNRDNHTELVQSFIEKLNKNNNNI